MENLTAEVGECALCLHSSIFYPTVLCYILIFLPANGRVMWLMKSSPIFWTEKMEVSEFHLVLTEFLFGFLGPPTIIASFYESTLLRTTSNIINILFTARIQFQCSVCMERYVAVVHPVFFLRFKPLRYRMTFCCVVWLQSLLLGIVQLSTCTENRVTLALYTTLFIFVFIINSFFCLSVLWVLKKPSPGKRETEGSKKVKRKAFNVVLLFQVTTFLGCVPLIVMLFLIWELHPDTFCLWQPLTYSLVVWLGAVYPLHYLRRSGKMPK